MSARHTSFSGPMVRAILAGRKTQTRRVITPQPIGPLKGGECLAGVPGMYMVGDTIWPISAGYRIVSNMPGPHASWVSAHVRVKAGDRLYVREAWRAQKVFDHLSPKEIGKRFRDECGAPDFPVLYEADTKCDDWSADAWQQSEPGRLRQSRHMPRAASRITLVVTDVRVQRLQEISDAEAVAEGIRPCGVHKLFPQMSMWGLDGEQLGDGQITAFSLYWDNLNAERGFDWDKNPWVCATTFTPIFKNIDQIKDGEA